MNYESLINQTVLNTAPSGIRKYFDIASKMENCISLGVGEPDFVTPWYIREAAIDSIREGATCYTSNAGIEELRLAIADYYQQRYNVTYDLSEILITVGASEALDLSFRTLISPGDEVLLLDPSYVSYQPGISFAGGIPVPIRLSADNSFKLTAEALRNAITPRTKALVLAYPNNPTGATMNREDFMALANVLRDTDIFIISDEIYSELQYGKEPSCSFASIPDMRERTITINGFSKAFAMTGWRLGYLMAPQELTQQILKVHQLTMLCASIMSQNAGITALRGGLANHFEEVEKMRTQYNRRRQYLVHELNDMGLSCFEPLGAFYVFPSISSTGLTSEEFCEKLLYSERLATVPGTAFGPGGEGFVRISYAYSMAHLQEAIRRLRCFLQSN